MLNAEPVQQSLVSWMLASLGPAYTFLLPLAALLSFILVLVLVFRGHGPMAAVSLILIIHVPLFIGIFAALQGAMASYTVIAVSAVAPKPAEVAEGISTALVAPLVGMLLMAPSYMTAAIGSFIRSLASKATTAEPGFDA